MKDIKTVEPVEVEEVEEEEVITQEEVVIAEKSLDEVIEMAVEKAIEKIMEKMEKIAHSKTVILNGAVTGETGREAPDKRVDFSKLSYSELCSFLEKHPKAKLGGRI